MKVIGISGLHNAMPFLKRTYPSMPEKEYRICQGQDSAACLVVEGKLIAAVAEERFNGEKHSSRFPFQSINYCLKAGNLQITDIDAICHNFNYSRLEKIFFMSPVYNQVFSPELIKKKISEHFPLFDINKLFFFDHHDCHESSAFYGSTFDECLSVIVDGMSETDGASIYYRYKNKKKVIKRIPANSSIGIFYSLVTMHLGLEFNSDEYKIMGLAPYGDPKRYNAFFDKQVHAKNGSLKIPLLQINKTPLEKQFYLLSRKFLKDNLIKEREHDEPITQDHKDIAAALQGCLDRVLLHLCSYYGNKLNASNLVMAGGVALNCTANGKILNSGKFNNIFIQPASGDDGTALGAAWLYCEKFSTIPRKSFDVPFLGPEYTNNQIHKSLDVFKQDVEILDLINIESVIKSASNDIVEGKVIAWYQGRMEFGPRALGNRSILGDPSRIEMRDRINQMVKKRESFRPFAPAIIEEEASKYFSIPNGISLPFMIFVVSIKDEFQQRFPAITHVNSTARVQTVSQDQNPIFYKLLKGIEKYNQVPMVLNTSFNVKGQPIVNTPHEAIETFINTDIDALYLGNYLVTRKIKSISTPK